MSRDRTAPILLATLAAVLVIGFFLPQWAKFLLTIALAKGLLVLGLLPLMRTGLVSFGRASGKPFIPPLRRRYGLDTEPRTLLDHPIRWSEGSL